MILKVIKKWSLKVEEKNKKKTNSNDIFVDRSKSDKLIIWYSKWLLVSTDWGWLLRTLTSTGL